LTVDSFFAVILSGYTPDVWELRPGNNRILYFYYQDNTFVLLHVFRKKTQKIPRREIEKAIAAKNDYLNRKEVLTNDHLE